MQHLHAIKNFLDYGIQTFLNQQWRRQLASRNLLFVNHSGPIYKFIYPESEPVLLAGDKSERQSLTRTNTQYINFYILLVL